MLRVDGGRCKVKGSRLLKLAFPVSLEPCALSHFEIAKCLGIGKNYFYIY